MTELERLRQEVKDLNERLAKRELPPMFVHRPAAERQPQWLHGSVATPLAPTSRTDWTPS